MTARLTVVVLLAAVSATNLPADDATSGPGYAGRSAAQRKAQLEKYGGTAESEAAVSLGLAWLARQQQQAGNWEFDGQGRKDVPAATGLALLPFLAAGQTHKKSADPADNKYTDKVALGINWLLKQQKPDGSFNGSTGMYSHAISTIALCECYGMTGDKVLLRDPAQQAVNFILTAQGADGSWGYQAKTNGDSSILGWQIQAIQSARYCKDLALDKKVLGKATEFLDKVAWGSTKANYGYTSPGTSKTLTPVGLLCRHYLEGWGPQHPGMHTGIEFVMKAQLPSDTGDFNMYYYYYATRLMRAVEGDAWAKGWNPLMRNLLVKRQNPQKEKSAEYGSWDQDKGVGGTQWGRLGSTCFALLCLQEYYRFAPPVKGLAAEAAPARPTVAVDAVTVKPVVGEFVYMADTETIHELYFKSGADVRNDLVKLGRVKVVTEDVTGTIGRTVGDFNEVRLSDGTPKGKTYLVKSKFVEKAK